MLHSTDSERLSNKNSIRVDAVISLGRASKVDFACGLGAVGLGMGAIRLERWRNKILG